MTSTTTSSSVRQTPGFAVPSTQNTAPVLEFRCLYTHDLRRKQKRWQDGLLRFHAFNKRIMVYDVSRNYIGDMHWREDEVLQDGDEFQLDRGILIQVGEATGSMEQDLTGLLEKRKKAPEVVVNEEVLQQPVAVPMAGSIAAQPPQLRPKTLNALLGTPKGRIGRAALPTKSPHELRLESENSNWDEDRPAKRQRIEPQLKRRTEPNKMPPPRIPADIRGPDEGVNRTVAGTLLDKQSEERRVPTTMKSSSLSRAEITVTRPPIAPIQRSRNGKEDEASKRAVEPLPKKRPSGPGGSESTAQQKKRKPDQVAQVSPKAKKIAKRLDHEPETSYARSSTIAKPTEIASDEDAASNNKQPKRNLKLQMVSRKPRKKLMYRDLLPQDVSTIGSSDDASVLDRNNRDRSTSSRADKRKGDPMAGFHNEEQERLKDRLERHRAKEIHRENEREAFCGDAPEDLFLSQEDIDGIPAKNHRTEEKEPKENAPRSPLSGSRRRNTEPISPLTSPPLSQEAPQQVIPRPSSTVHSTAMNLAKMDEILVSRARPGTSEVVEDKPILIETSPQESTPTPIPKTPPDVASKKPFKDRPDSSPAFQTQAHVPPLTSLKSGDLIGTSTVSRLDPDSLCAFMKVVQPKVQQPKPLISKIQLPDSHLSSLPATPPKTISSPSPLQVKEGPVSASDLQNYSNSHPAKSLNPEPPNSAVVPPITNVKTNTLPTLSNVVPKPPTAPEPVPRNKPNNQPAFTKVIPTIPIPKFPDETVEVLSSQRSSSPPPEAPPTTAPHPRKRKPDSLPAFTKVIPTKPRSPLKKSISDTSAMRPPSALPSSGGKEKKALPDNPGGKDERASLWSKEAWDLFGCSRDGVECTYEEFKRKEGLM